MSDYPAYDAVLQALQDGGVVVDDKYKAIGDAATTLCDVNQTVSQIPDASVVRNRDGDVIGYDYRYTGPKLPDTDIMEVDSNTDTGWYASGGGGSSGGGGAGRYNGSYYAGKVVTDPQTTDKLTGGGLVSGLISAGWAGVSALAKFGKSVTSDTGEALASLAEHLATDFGNLFVDVGDATGDAIRALFGVDSQGNTTMYLEEDIIGAAAIAAKDEGFFDSGETTVDSLPSDIEQYIPQYARNALPWVINYGERFECITNQNYHAIWVTSIPVYSLSFKGDNGIGTGHLLCSKTPFTSGFNRYSSTPSLTNPSREITYKGETMYYTNYTFNYQNNGDVIGVTNIITGQNVNSSLFANALNPFVYSVLFCAHQGQSVPGVSDQTGATIPVDAITGADPHVVAQNLESQYPAVMGTPVQIVVMDDSCNEVTKNYYSVPISYSPTNLNISAPITGGLQVSPSFNPDVTLDLPDIDMDNYLDQIIKVLGGSGAGRNVTTEPEPEDPSTPSTEIEGGILPPEPPATGSGTSPTVVPPTTDVTSMWHVYNPEPEGLSGLGSWLWSSSIIDQIVRLFTNPMEAIMGVHAIYCVPDTSSSAPIVVGNLTSTASARPVTSQYKEFSCGEVWLTEYFGNVFDYEPHTSVSLYLPFVGIVPLSVADVMRAKIGVSYIVDVYTGACVARVNVERDGVGGILYEFPGDCSVKYPVSGASYTGLIQSVVSAAMSAVRVGMITGGAPGTGILGAAVAGSTFISSGQKISISHSGSFSGNHGAMGSKIPYLIISRPVPEMAENFEFYDGLPANKQIQLSSCSGYTKCKEVHLTATGAYKSELDELERLLRTGIIL